MDGNAFIENLRHSRHYRDQIVCVHRIEQREARYADLAEPLPPLIVSALEKMNITRLYTHQVQSIESIRRGESIVVVTGTASGKTLCYNIPVLETLIRAGGESPIPTAFYVFPTKALAQDQLRGLRRYAELEPALASVISAGCYDGDTPPSTRRRLRDSASIILTNPDMLNQGILPYHTRWNEFFANLRYVVVDEIHTYRGIFGSNTANVLRRLRRICAHYGSNPQFLCSSATIANPLDLAERLTGIPMTLVDDDGSPRGEKYFVMWNPPVTDPAGLERRSSNVEAQDLMVALMSAGVRTITFGRARIVAELMYRYVRDALPPGLRDRVRAYRGGYLPEERREIERQLFEGELIGITSTNALELGIDIGGLDAAIIIGFPGTVASLWQQAGRAGRSHDQSVVVFVGYNDPIDQYLMRHPGYFFSQSPESAVVDPQNPYVLAHHLSCAAFELPLKPRDSQSFGPRMAEVARVLVDAGILREIDGTWYYCKTDFPAKDVNLRTISDDTFSIVDMDLPPAPDASTSELMPRTRETPAIEGQVIGQVDSISAPELVYPGAVYMHEGETYFVEHLDLTNHVACVRRADVDYYTNAILDASIRVYSLDNRTTVTEADHERTGQTKNEGTIRSRDLETSTVGPAPASLFLGPATVTWATTGFKKIKFYSLDSIGYGKVDIPPQHLETMAFWLVPAQFVLDQTHSAGLNPAEGLIGIRNLMVHILPLYAMCDKQDVGGIVDSSNTGSPTVFIYDRYSGGLGFAEKGYHLAEELLCACRTVVEECSCEEGCPSCVGLPVLRPPIHTDPDVFGAYPIPNKEAARILLSTMLRAGKGD